MSVYSKLSTRQLQKIGVIIQLADRFVVYPEGVLKDVLVQVDNYIFPVDFYVLDMEDDKSPNPSDLLLGRLLLNTTKSKIDIQDGTLTMEFDEEVVKFNVYHAMRYPSELSYVYSIGIINSLNQKYFDLSHGDEVNITLCNALNSNSLRILEEDHVTN